MRENIPKYIKQQMHALMHSDFTFSGLFNIIYNQDERIFGEWIELTGLKTFKYKDAKDYCYQMATYLLPKITAPKGSYVGLCMENCINWPTVFWALLMTGYKPMLLNCRLPLEVNNNIINLLNIKDVVTNKQTHNPGLNAKQIILGSDQVDSEIRKLDKYQPIAWANEIALSSTATSLNYKLAVYTGKDITNIAINAKDIIAADRLIKKHYKHRLKQLTVLPFYHIFGLIAVYFWFTIFGRTMVFLKDYSSSTIVQTIRTAEVTHIFAVPLFWNTIAKTIYKQLDNLPDKKKKMVYKAIDKSIALQNGLVNLGPKIARKIFKEVIDKSFGPSVLYCISGGSYLAKDTLKLINGIGYHLTTGYGTTEASITCVELRAKPKYRISGSVGKPLPTVVIKQQDGTLQIQGWSTCSRIITKDNKRYDIHSLWYDLKDVGHFDKDGFLYIDGRTDDVITNRNGEKINPDLIESKLKLNYVKNFVITNVDGETTLIIQTPINPPFYLIQKIVKEVKEQYELIKNAGYSVDTIKYTTDPICSANAIKVSRKLLDTWLLQQKVVLHNFEELSRYEQSSSETINDDLVNKIRAIFAQILNKDENTISLDQHFILDLGGTSLDYFTLIEEIKTQLDIAIEVNDTSLMTINDFCHYITKGGK